MLVSTPPHRTISIRPVPMRSRLRPGKIRSRRCWKGSLPPKPISARRRSPTMTPIRLDRSSIERRPRRLPPPVQARTRCPPARAMLDAQASSARDNGKELVFNSGRKTGQQVDFTEFDNGSLAIMALNADASFSVAEASAAKAELNQRTRSGVLNAFDPGGGLKASTQALLQQYSTMSAEEKKVLGFTDDFANKIMQNYRAMSSLQNSVGSGAGLTAYF